MTVDEMLGAIEQIRLQMGWREPTPDTERLKSEALAKVDAIAAQARAANDMPTLRRLQRRLDAVLPAYYRGLAALRSSQAS